MLRLLTAGESHGPALLALLDGLPAGLPVSEDDINLQLRRRQGGYGRGSRQRIECDQVVIQSGVANGVTIGAPVALMIVNNDYDNWRNRQVPPWTRPRPGHADLAGSIKYDLADLRLVAERASARETAARVAAGTVTRGLLTAVGVRVGSYVESIGGVHADCAQLPLLQRVELAEQSPIRCPDAAVSEAMCRRIDEAVAAGESLGGVFLVAALGVPVGLGTYTQWDRRLDGLLAQAVMSIPAVKGIEIGEAFANTRMFGTQVQDGLYPAEGMPQRLTNRAGGLEGGMTNGEPLLIRAAMKPIPTTLAAQPTVDLATASACETQYQRSDVCAVPAASVVGEAMVSFVLAQALLERFGGDTLDQVVRAVKHG